MKRILSIVSVTFSLQVFAAEKDLKKVEDVLDRLEKRILDHDMSGMSFGSGTPEKPATSKMQMQSTKVEAELPENEKIKDIAAAVSEIENQIDQLESDFQKTRQKILERANQNNTLDLSLVTPDADKAAIKYLRILVDGFEVYELSQPSGIWSPKKKVPVFSGPIAAGTHKIELEASIIQKAVEGMPLNADNFHTVRANFDVSTSKGQPNSIYEIVVAMNDKSEKYSVEIRSKNFAIPLKDNKAPTKISKKIEKKEIETKAHE